jgi:hypothetical protein
MQLMLNNLIHYQNQHVIRRYDKDYPDAKLTGVHAFQELMKYIWLGCKHKYDKQLSPDNDALDFRCMIHTEMKEIDNMWHTFLLFTREYQFFCEAQLGGIFFHHEPSIEKGLEPNDKYELELSRYLSYIYDNLGEETLIKWFCNNATN